MGTDNINQEEPQDEAAMLNHLPDSALFSMRATELVFKAKTFELKKEKI